MRNGEKRRFPAGPRATCAARRRATPRRGASGRHRHPVRQAWPPGGTRADRLSRNRPSQTAPGRAATGGDIAAASRATSSPDPIRPAGSSRTPASVAGLGSAASDATESVGGGYGAPAMVCSRAASTRALHWPLGQHGEAFRPQRHCLSQTGRHLPVIVGALPRRRGGRGDQRGGRGTVAVAVAPQQPQARAECRRVDIRRILDPRQARGRHGRAQHRRGHCQQRAQDAQAGGLDQRCDARHSCGAAASQRTDQHGFCLVGGVVSEQQVQDAFARADFGQDAKPGLPRAFRQGRAAGQAPDRQDACRDASRGEELGGLRRLGRGLLPQSMIDD